MKTRLMTLTKKDFEFQTFRCSGHGGQNVNKVETSVRIIHKLSNTREESCKYRTQFQNKKDAFLKLSKNKKFRQWLKIESLRRAQLIPTKEDLEKTINEMMDEKNLKIEYF